MKNQETVNQNFQKNILQWQRSQEKKVLNLKQQIDLIEEKKRKLSHQQKKLNEQIEHIQGTVPPSPPNSEERSSQLSRLRAQYPGMSDASLNALADGERF